MKRYHGVCKYRQINFFPNVVKDVRPTYGNKEELAPLNLCNVVFFVLSKSDN